MLKNLKEFMGGFRIGNLDSLQPIASLGDTPPKDQGTRDNRAVGLTAQDKDPTDKDSKKIQKKNSPVKETLSPFKKKILQKISKPIKDYNKKKEKKEDLYSDDNPKDTVKGTGYGDAEAAKKTLQIIKSVDKERQMQIVNTMYNRAKHHANQTADMRLAMSIFKKWIDDNKIKESVLYKHMTKNKE